MNAGPGVLQQAKQAVVRSTLQAVCRASRLHSRRMHAAGAGVGTGVGKLTSKYTSPITPAGKACLAASLPRPPATRLLHSSLLCCA